MEASGKNAIILAGDANGDIESGICREMVVTNRLSRLESAIQRIEGKVNAVFEATKSPSPPSPPPPKKRFFGGIVTHHQAWWLLILPLNIACMGIVLGGDRTRADRAELATTLALANLVATVAIRDGTVLLWLYKAVVRIPWQKYFFNRMLHCNGGIHTGCALMLLVWAIIALVETGSGDPVDCALLAMLCAGLLAMMLLAVQPLRERHHNLFETVHRYLGWTLLVLLAAILVKEFTDMRWRLSAAAIGSAVLMGIALILVFYSWFLIERQDVEVRSGREGNIVVVKIKGKARAGAFAKISFNLVEWHAFSVAFSNRESGSYGLIVGVAGDWTKMLAQKCTPLERIMSSASSLRKSLSRASSLRMMNRASSMRKISEEHSTISAEDLISAPPPPPTDQGIQNQTVRAFIRWHRPLGFMYSVYAYKRVICVGTGAGIAPILPHIGSDRVAMHVVWIAKKHREIYGDEICDRVFQHPHTIYDTSKQGRPRPEIALLDYEEFHPEAIFIVSNAPFTEAVRDVCKNKQIPAFGAVFDS
ncbi:adenylate-forming reductase 03009-like [Selaginella moellendorffii]|uniref:adenylate-forming reductase 03009-like n=1 Tax=Selaginella moellendorffii TaxID=88036 RepID=UPI000D1C34DE|nr:adenylate-forming reductase 03009-like [Selaginella moellendorffii]|eukprot:XP_024525454.1 adenylate-forming reductase 03009-like [Selaginella moellendorffii]